MKIVVFGVSGRIGSRIAQEALRRGHEVTAVARDPSRVKLAHPKLRVTRGDATTPASVAAAVAGHDVVVTSIGPDLSKGVGTVLTDAARALLQGLKQAKVKRLIVVGGAGSLEAAPGLLVMNTPQFPADWKPLAQSHADALAVYRAEKELDWSYLSPAALIEPGTRTGSYRIGGEKLVTDAAGNSRISMEDYAVAILDEVERPRHSRTRFSVAY
jgi:putative NADH-flavin reductase